MSFGHGAGGSATKVVLWRVIPNGAPVFRPFPCMGIRGGGKDLVPHFMVVRGEVRSWVRTTSWIRAASADFGHDVAGGRSTVQARPDRWSPQNNDTKASANVGHW